MRPDDRRDRQGPLADITTAVVDRSARIAIEENRFRRLGEKRFTKDRGQDERRQKKAP